MVQWIKLLKYTLVLYLNFDWAFIIFIINKTPIRGFISELKVTLDILVVLAQHRPAFLLMLADNRLANI